MGVDETERGMEDQPEGWTADEPDQPARTEGGGRSDADRVGGDGSVPKHLWVVGILAVLWNAVGAFDYLATQLEWEFYMSQFTEAQLAYFYGFPAWAVACWAVAVWGALAGSVGLLLRRRWSVAMFGASLLGMALTTLYSYGLSDGAAVMGSTGTVFTIVVAAVSIFLFLYARRQAQAGVLV